MDNSLEQTDIDVSISTFPYVFDVRKFLREVYSVSTFIIPNYNFHPLLISIDNITQHFKY